MRMTIMICKSEKNSVVNIPNSLSIQEAILEKGGNHSILIFFSIMLFNFTSGDNCSKNAYILE